MHLWDVEHPYYMNEGNYFSRGNHESFDSLSDFLSGYGDIDVDMNLVVRWDWHDVDREEYLRFSIDDFDETDVVPDGILRLHMIHQRKAILRSFDIKVMKSEEDAIRAYLQPHMDTLAAMWAPMQPGPQPTNEIEPGASSD